MVYCPTRRVERAPRLTAPQLEVLRVLWVRSEPTGAEIHRVPQADRPLAATTIATRCRDWSGAGSLPTGSKAGSTRTPRSSVKRMLDRTPVDAAAGGAPRAGRRADSRRDELSQAEPTPRCEHVDARR